MMQKFRVLLFYVFFSLLFLSNMWGVFHDTHFTQFAIYVAPFALFSTYLISKEKIILPFRLTVVSILFLCAVVISTVTAVHIQKAFEQQLFYIAVFLIAVFVYNNAESLKKYIVLFLVTASLLSLQYSLLLVIGGETFKPLIPYHDEQLIYRLGGLSHYPQGIFLFIIATVAYIHMLEKQALVYITAFIGSLVFLWLSYLRAAYVGFAGVVFLNMHHILRKKTVILGITVSILSIFLLFVPLATTYRIPVLSPIYDSFIPEHSAFSYKDFANGRLGFVESALSAIKERPLTGYGSANFSYASLRYSKNIDAVVGTSHNFFLDMFAENGVVAGALMISLIALLLWKIVPLLGAASTDKKIIISLFVGFLIIFQFNFYHLMAFLFLLFFVLAMLAYHEKREVRDMYIVPSLSLFLMVIGIFIGTAYYLNGHGHSSTALRIYPIYENAYHNRFRELYQNDKNTELDTLLNSYAALFAESPYNLSYLGDTYRLRQDEEKALYFYEQALKYAPRQTEYLVKVYDLIVEKESKEEATIFVEKHVQQYPILYPNIYFEDREWFENWCLEHTITCDHTKN